jgi:hypothetical protein
VGVRSGVLRRPFPALVALAVVVLAGCGDDDDATTGTGPDAPVTSPPGDPGAGDAPPGGVERRLLEATPGLVDPRPSAVESFAEVGGTTIELRFYAGVEACYGLEAVEVVEESESVTVTVLVGSRPTAEACIDIAEAVATRIDLGSPLGGRPLLDGSTGQAVPVE